MRYICNFYAWTFFLNLNIWISYSERALDLKRILFWLQDYFRAAFLGFRITFAALSPSLPAGISRIGIWILGHWRRHRRRSRLRRHRLMFMYEFAMLYGGYIVI